MPLVRRTVETAIAARTGPVRRGARRRGLNVVESALAGARIRRSSTPTGPVGSRRRIRAGVRWAESTGANALVVVLADQPRIPASHLRALRDAWLAVPRSRRRAGATLSVRRDLRPRALAGARGARGDRGAGALMGEPDVVAIDCADGAVDVDTTVRTSALSR